MVKFEVGHKYLMPLGIVFRVDTRTDNVITATGYNWQCKRSNFTVEVKEGDESEFFTALLYGREKTSQATVRATDIVE